MLLANRQCNASASCIALHALHYTLILLSHCITIAIAGHVQLPPGHVDWAPTVIPDDIPKIAIFSDAPVAAYASLNDHVSKFSFALFDYIYPVFNLLKLLGVYDPNFQLILAEQHQVSPTLRTGCND